MIQSITRLARHDVKKLLPNLTPAVVALGESGEPAGLEEELIGLINLRASQINGCAYCVHMHIGELQELGVPQAKINLVVAWEEAGIFSEREQAALAWTEALTLIAETHVPDRAYEAARSVFSDLEMVGLTAAISTINVWNRIAVTFRYPPAI
jgi:AhpD family alkylhydroperoxidase